MKASFLWDFDGSCSPVGRESYGSQRTFSLGIFQWIPTANGKGLKRGKVVKRIRGLVSEYESVVAEARAECERRNKPPVDAGIERNQ